MGSKTSYRVQDQYRTNALSHIEGGVEVKIHYKDGEVRIYDKVKNPKRYIRSIAHKIKVENIYRIDVNGEIFWDVGYPGKPVWEED